MTLGIGGRSSNQHIVAKERHPTKTRNGRAKKPDTGKSARAAENLLHAESSPTSARRWMFEEILIR